MAKKRNTLATRSHRALSAQIVELQEALTLRMDLTESLRHELARNTERTKDLIAQHEQHAMVLLGDRDALTRTIEVLSRRLASPAADRDPYRAGWRGANMAINEQPLNQKATDPLSRR